MASGDLCMSLGFGVLGESNFRNFPGLNIGLKLPKYVYMYMYTRTVQNATIYDPVSKHITNTHTYSDISPINIS